jgi:hypothetical protein
MSLPASFLAQAERHGCFSGCFGHEARFEVCLDPGRPPYEMFAVYCKDCLSFRLGVLRSLLPPGSSAPWLADTLTAHNRRRRGFAWSLSGYHAVGPGFWLTAGYYAHCGLFLLNGAKSRSVGSDLDLLLLAFQYGVAAPTHARMTDPHEYTVRECYLDFSSLPGTIQAPQDLYSSPQCSLQPKRGYQRVTAAEFRPVAALASVMANSPAAATPHASSPVRPAAGPPRTIGAICPVCHAEIRERHLFTGSYIGCLCD